MQKCLGSADLDDGMFYSFVCPLAFVEEFSLDCFSAQTRSGAKCSKLPRNAYHHSRVSSCGAHFRASSVPDVMEKLSKPICMFEVARLKRCFVDSYFELVDRIQTMKVFAQMFHSAFDGVNAK